MEGWTQCCRINSCLIHWLETLQYKAHKITIIMPFILDWSAIAQWNMLMTLSCLREQGTWRHANTYVDRQGGQPIIALKLRDMIGWTFYSLTPSTDYINTYKSFCVFFCGVISQSPRGLSRRHIPVTSYESHGIYDLNPCLFYIKLSWGTYLHSKLWNLLFFITHQ